MCTDRYTWPMSSKQVLKLRTALGLTQQALADLIGAQRHSVARWEAGVHSPRGANLKQLRELAAQTGKVKRGSDRGWDGSERRMVESKQGLWPNRRRTALENWDWGVGEARARTRPLLALRAGVRWLPTGSAKTWRTARIVVFHVPTVLRVDAGT